MNIWQLFTGSFHRAAAYRHMREKQSFGMGYALVLVAVCTLVVTITYGALIHNVVFAVKDGRTPLFDDVVNQIAQQLPVMTLKDGTLKSSSAEPTTIYISANIFDEKVDRFPLITIDTSGNARHDNMPTPVLITDQDMIIQKSDGKKEIQPLSKFDQGNPLVINRAMAEDSAKNIIAFVHANLGVFYFIVGIVVWFFFTAFIYVMRIVMLLLLGLMGLVMGSILKNKVNYAQSVGLASLSYTPIALLDTVLFAFFANAPSNVTLFACGAVLLFFAIRASGAPKEPVMVG